jgi:hypothetical protein
MESRKKRQGKLKADLRGLTERSNEVVKQIPSVDTGKVNLTSAPFAAQKETGTLLR